MSQDGRPTHAWKTLNQVLPSRTPDLDYWWAFTGRHLAVMVDAADYAIEKQYEALLFHYHWTVPYMGPANLAKWKSLVNPDGTPIEYSWKWNTVHDKPEIRYDIEPIGESAGTILDPLNQLASKEMLHRLASAMPMVDVSLSDHFFATMYDHNNSKYMQEAVCGRQSPLFTTILIAAEFSRKKDIRFKTYFQPRKLGQFQKVLKIQDWEDSIQELDPNNKARALLHNFLANNPEGKLLNPFSISPDNVAPSKARMKWYFNTPHTSFASVREIMTLGGKVDRSQLTEQLADMQDLIKTVLALPSDFPEDKHVAASARYQLTVTGDEQPALMPGFVYYFDIAPGYYIPEIKLNIPLRNYGREDRGLAQSIVDWMTARGRGAFGQNYLDMLENMSEDGPLSESTGLQSFISCLLRKNGELDITTYISAKAANPEQSSKRSTRRRDENY
ncbi:dimethylallyl tryptophan synthase GliD1 [Bisporella sp. PMI_857]|nr:dimethylallyl tryptophan synthase GliD1 [Bisporella sp. PMI_857]